MRRRRTTDESHDRYRSPLTLLSGPTGRCSFPSHWRMRRPCASHPPTLARSRPTWPSAAPARCRLNCGELSERLQRTLNQSVPESSDRPSNQEVAHCVCTWPEGSLAADRLALAVGSSGSVGRVGHSHADLQRIIGRSKTAACSGPIST